MPQGYLSIETRIADGSLPVEGAKIYIAFSGSGSNVSENYYNYYLITDSSGNTGFIRVDAPDPKMSRNINNTQVPYSVVDVYAEADGFYPTRIKNVQVYADTQSILPINLIPVSGSYSDLYSGTISYDIPSNQLLSKDGHRMMGPRTGKSSDFRGNLHS